MIKALLISTSMAAALSACSPLSMPHDQHSKLDAAEKARKCQELREDIDDLKGKPMQRGAHQDYYNDLCLNSPIE